MRPRVIPTVPWDAVVVGSLHVVGAIVGLWPSVPLLLGLVHSADGHYADFTLLGQLGLRSGPWVGAELLAIAAMNAVAGWGLATGQRFGWWTALLRTCLGVITDIVNLGHFVVVPRGGMCLDVFFLLWLVIRIGFYRPFGGQSSVAKSGLHRA